jgi:redox-sensing transcriptional repressor
MKERTSVSNACLARLPRYLRLLKDRRESDIKTISSTDIARELKLKPIQVRKDLALVNEGSGKHGVGFEINDLIYNIENYLGVRTKKNVIIIGAGRLGQALMNYNGFENDIQIVMAFDKDKRKCNDKNIIYIDRLEEFVKKKRIKVAVLTIPGDDAQSICDRLVRLGVKAIWNFAPTNLKVPEGVVVKNEDLSASLTMLLNKLKYEEDK